MPTDLIMYLDRPRYLGRWLLGEPVGEFGFEKLPRVPALTEAAGQQEKLDIRTANAAISVKPRLAWDALLEVRGTLAQFAAMDQRLRADGFTMQALKAQLWKQAGESAAATMREAAGRGVDATEHVGKWRAKLAAETFLREESDAERVAYDLAIAQRFASANAGERARLRLQGGARVLAALERAPRVISSVTDDELAEARDYRLKTDYPHSVAAFEALLHAVNPLRTAIVAGLGMIDEGAGRTVAELVSGWGAAGEWVVSGA